MSAVGIAELKYKSSKASFDDLYGSSGKATALEEMPVGREAYWDDVVALMQSKTATPSGDKGGTKKASSGSSNNNSNR